METPIILFCLDVAAEQALIFKNRVSVCVCVSVLVNMQGGQPLSPLPSNVPPSHLPLAWPVAAGEAGA